MIKGQFDALLAKLMQAPPEPARGIETNGKAGKTILSIQPYVLIRHGLDPEHPQGRVEPILLFPSVESRLELDQVTMQVLYRDGMEIAYDGPLEQ